MTVKEFITKLEIDDLDNFLYDMAANGVLVSIIEQWLREFALINCAQQKELCDIATDELKENDYAVRDAPYPEI